MSDIIESAVQDVFYALRAFRKSPGFAVTAILTLALGIGITTAVFSVVYGVLFRPLPFKDSERIVRLVQLQHSGPPDNVLVPFASISSDDLKTLRTRPTLFSQMAAYYRTELTLREDKVLRRVRTVAVSQDMFPLLGVTPLLGRSFDPGEAREGGNGVVILSYGAWEKYFGRSPNVLQRTVSLSGIGHTVVGVMPQSFSFPDRETEFWLPLVLEPRQRTVAFFHALARLSDGVEIEAATTEANAIFRELRPEEKYLPADRQTRLELISLKEELVEPVRQAFLVLMIAVSFVLVIACGNVANLLLARATGRGGEMAIRTALGAGRRRLIRQVFTESMMLALIGGTLGTALSLGGIRIVTTMVAGDIPRTEDIRLDMPILLFALAVSILTGIVFGLAPALRLPRVDHIGAMQRGAALTSSGSDLFGHNRSRSFLATAEIALAMILLSGSGLLINSFVKLTAADWGYNPHNLLTFKIDLDNSSSKSATAHARFLEELLFRLRQLPEARAATAVGDYALPIWQPSLGFAGPGRVSSGIRVIGGSDYLKTFELRLIEGRGFDDRDRAGGPPIILVNRTLIRQFFPTQSAVGREFGPFGTIVGVVDDFRYPGLDKDAGPEVFVHEARAAEMPAPPAPPGLSPGGTKVSPFAATYIVVRTAGDPMQIVPTIRSIVGDMDPSLFVDDVTSLEQRLAEYVARPRFYAMLVSIFSIIAVTLAAIGIYGLVNYSVASRSREIGIRIALGAGRGQILWMVLRQGFLPAGIGLAAGIFGALQLTRYLKNLLYGLSTTDPMTFIIVAAVIAAAAGLACYVPALRATRVDPVIALKHE